MSSKYYPTSPYVMLVTQQNLHALPFEHIMYQIEAQSQSDYVKLLKDYEESCLSVKMWHFLYHFLKFNFICKKVCTAEKAYTKAYTKLWYFCIQYRSHEEKKNPLFSEENAYQIQAELVKQLSPSCDNIKDY